MSVPVSGTGVPTAWDDLSRLDPEFAQALTVWVDAAYAAPALPAHVRSLLLLAQDASMTVLDEVGMERRMVEALEAGAGEDQVLEVLELVCFLATHGLATGLTDVVGTDAVRPESHAGGYWDEFEEHFPGLNGALNRHLPEILAASDELGAVVWRRGALEPRWKELVFVVADLAVSHLFRPGALLHARNALHYGATLQQVAEAIALTVVPVTRTIDLGLPALARARERVAAARD